MTAKTAPAPALDQRGPGRPPIGRMINVRMPDDLVAWLDENRGDDTRAQFVRDALQYARALEYPVALEEAP